MDCKFCFLALLFLLFSCTNNNSSIKKERELLERHVLEKRVLKDKLTERENKKSNSNHSSSSSSSSSSNNCETYATLKFDATHSCIIKSTLSVSKVNGYSNVNIDNFYKSASISNSKCIKGEYKFSWTYSAQCINIGEPDGPYSYSGTFYIDGEHTNYTIYISDGMFDTTIRVDGY
jgi:hypothetical protein